MEQNLQPASTEPSEPAGGKRPRKKYPPVERGVRVRAYPSCEQEETLRALCFARAMLWNCVCDVFERDGARRRGDVNGAGGLLIECSRKAIAAEIARVRHDPRYAWLSVLCVWTCNRIVKHAFQARSLAFETGAEHPHGNAVLWDDPGTWCTDYDGRKSDRHYTPGKAMHLSATGTIALRTGDGHMPDTMARNPTVTVSVDACQRWWLSFCVCAPGGAERWALAHDGAEFASHETLRAVDSLDVSRIVSPDLGLNKLMTFADGTSVDTAKHARESERRARLHRNARKGRRKARRDGHPLDAGAARKKLRALKRARVADAYRCGGDIATKRAATKGARLAKHERAVKHAKEARRLKLEAAAAQQAATLEKAACALSAAHDGPAKDKDASSPKRASCAKRVRKTPHPGKGHGKRRRAARKDACARKGRRLDRQLSRRQANPKRPKACQNTKDCKGPKAPKKSSGDKTAKLARARHYAWMRNHRGNHNHVATSCAISRAVAIACEGLNTGALARGMLGKAVLDAGFAMVLHQLRYKALWADIPFVQCPTFFPSSQLCSECDWQFKELKLSQRTWTCPRCATLHDRDVNGSRNIRSYAVQTLRNYGIHVSTPRTQRSGGTGLPSREPARPGSASSVADTEACAATAPRTWNREQVKDELNGTASP